MPDEVLNFLVENGGGTVDEIVSRLSVRPQNIAESLVENASNGYLRVSGPGNLTDFSSLVHRVVVEANLTTRDKRQQRLAVLQEITRAEPKLRETVVHPTARGLLFALR